MRDTTEAHGEPRQRQHGWHRVPKGGSVCESVWLGLAARCSDVPDYPAWQRVGRTLALAGQIACS